MNMVIWILNRYSTCISKIIIVNIVNFVIENEGSSDPRGGGAIPIKTSLHTSIFNVLLF